MLANDKHSTQIRSAQFVCTMFLFHYHVIAFSIRNSFIPTARIQGTEGEKHTEGEKQHIETGVSPKELLLCLELIVMSHLMPH